MCRRVDCPKCGRPTFAGCGRHVEQVLGNVPPTARCRCHERQPAGSNTTSGGGIRERLRGLFGK